MKKIVFGITSLRPGGAERVLIDLVNQLKNQYQITIMTLYGNGEFTKQIDSSVSVFSLFENKREDYSRFQQLKISLSLLIPKIRRKWYRRFLAGRFDIEVAFLEGPITWLMAEPSEAKKIVWIHNDISAVFGKGWKARSKAKLNQHMYDGYEHLVFVSQDNLEKFEKQYPNNKQDKRVIYNYINQNVVLKKAKEKTAFEIKTDLPSFVQVSRLMEQKAVDRLIDVHKKLIEDGVLHRIYVVGDGPLRESLQNKIHELQVEDTFVLLGQKENPYPYIKKADYFLLASYYEGYPMVLLEAKVLNKRILITDSAAREVLLDYPEGMVVANNEEGIYNGMKTLVMTQKRKKVLSSFSNQNILEEVKELLGD